MKFSVFMTDKFMNADIEELDVSQRSYNILRRMDVRTVGDLVNKISGENDLLKQRNCGKTSAKEIMKKLFYFHLNTLDDHQKDKYFKKIESLNSRESQ